MSARTPAQCQFVHLSRCHMAASHATGLSAGFVRKVKMGTTHSALNMCLKVLLRKASNGSLLKTCTADIASGQFGGPHRQPANITSQCHVQLCALVTSAQNLCIESPALYGCQECLCVNVKQPPKSCEQQLAHASRMAHQKKIGLSSNVLIPCM